MYDYAVLSTDLRLEEALPPFPPLFPLLLPLGDFDFDFVFLFDLDGEREREVGDEADVLPLLAPDAAFLAVAVLRGLAWGDFAADDEEVLFVFDFFTVLFFDFDGLRPFVEEEGLRPRPLPLPLPDEDDEEEEEDDVVFGLLFDLLFGGFFDFVILAGDLLRLLRTFFSPAGLFDFFSLAPAFLAAVGDKRKDCLF